MVPVFDPRAFDARAFYAPFAGASTFPDCVDVTLMDLTPKAEVADRSPVARVEDLSPTAGVLDLSPIASVS
jgi:hypothetical protein